MSNENRPKTADWAPGTLDNTRKNIGSISAQEAEEMAHRLGGEVMRERDSRQQGGTGQKKRGAIPRAGARGAGGAATGGGVAAAQPVQAKPPKREELPQVSRHVNSLIDKLMMSYDYKIKPNYGIFNFIRKFQKDGTERVIPAFVDVTLKMQMTNMETFITDIKTIIQLAPNTYKAKIVGDGAPKFQFLRMVADWTMQQIKFSYINLTSMSEPILVQDLIPFVRAIYRPLISVYYYGEGKIPKLIKEIHNDISAHKDVDAAKVSALAKEAITQWLYISTEIIQKLYPLLMRMATTVYQDYTGFFIDNVAEILGFLGLHKYDLLLPEKPQEKQKSAQEKASEPAAEIRGKRDEVVDTGISLLNRLFPGAGFDRLSEFPDMFPYFQPLYNFTEGFNILSRENPMQVVVVLVRILEDFFRGCRNIEFEKPAEDDDKSQPQMKRRAQAETDDIAKVLDEWSEYRESVFEKIYCSPLKSLVNETYSKPEFIDSQLGKKYITEIMWHTKTNFLPIFKFQQLTLERPTATSKYAPLFMRTDFARAYMTEVVKECDKVAKTRGAVRLAKNPWDRYRFDIPNEISKRLDVLLGAQNMSETTNATNANLLKYALCILAVLDWWVNNPQSPAYSADPMNIFRVSMVDGKPEFSAEVRKDQNKLFAEAVKAAYAKKNG